MIEAHKISADTILDGKGKIFKDHVIIVEESGEILAIDPITKHTDGTNQTGEEIQKHKGTIIPGLINTHCHLELSHLQNRIPTGTGLVPFITSVVQLRDVPQEKIDQAIVNADRYMFESGIQAVGDISNKSDTAKIKSKSPISYYTFVEMFDLMNPNITQASIEQYTEAFEAQSEEGLNEKSLVPHAPYSVSPELFRYIQQANPTGKVVSIHNQETQPENQMFQTNNGEMVNFFSNIGMPISDFPEKGVNSIDYALKYMNDDLKTIFVHNTMCTAADLKKAKTWSENIYWATCPNANLYIENTLPNYQLFLEQDCKLVIGTDSLSSNWQLSIWEEMKTILKYQSGISFHEVLKWATINGAHALDYHDIYGSIEVGKKPGILLINANCDEDGFDIQGCSLKRLI